MSSLQNLARKGIIETTPILDFGRQTGRSGYIDKFQIPSEQLVTIHANIQNVINYDLSQGLI